MLRGCFLLETKLLGAFHRCLHDVSDLILSNCMPLLLLALGAGKIQTEVSPKLVCFCFCA